MRMIAISMLVLWGQLTFSADFEPIYQPTSPTAAKIARTPFDQVKEAIKAAQTKAIYELLEQHDDLIDQTNDENSSLLHFAVHYGNFPAVKYLHSKIKKRWFQSSLIEKKTKTNSHTALHLAIIGKHKDIAVYLIEQCKAEYSAQHVILAVAVGDKNIIEYLVNKLGKDCVIDALDRARFCQTTGEVLFYLGNTISPSSLMNNPQLRIKAYLEDIFNNYKIPIACEFIRGFEQQDNHKRTFPMDELLDEETAAKVRDYIKHPEKYITE